MNEINDAVQVEKCLRGNSRAFEPLIDKYQKALFNVTLRMVNNQQDAEDIVQDVFIKAYNKLGSYNPRYKFFSWIYRIAVNESINHVKKQKKEDVELDEAISDHENPAKIFDKKELQKRVNDTLSLIDPKYRILIILCQMQNCPYDEAARILNIDEKKVKSRLYTGRQLLKDLLIKEGLETDA
jgi:RNA polymerase sigma-70 factor, ECF subfamily